MGRLERLKYRLLSIKAWFAEKRRTRRYAWWAGFGYSYMLAGVLQAVVFSKTIIGLTLVSFMKFALIWPLWSYATVAEDTMVGVGVLEFIFDAEIQAGPPQPSKQPAQEWPA